MIDFDGNIATIIRPTSGDAIGAGGMLADTERRREQFAVHRQDRDHTIWILKDGAQMGNRKQPRPEQHNRRR